MNTQRLLPRAILVMALLPLLPGCGKRAETPGQQATPEQPVAGGTLTAAVEAEPENLNPMIYTSTYAGDVMSIVHEPVISMNDRFEWEPTLCDSWEWSADHLTLTFHIRKGIRWNDGAPFSAYDVASTYRLCQNEDVPYRYRSNFNNWEGVEAPDSSTVVIRYKVVYPDQMFDTNFHILPAHIVDALDPKTIAEWPINRRPVTVGPYRLADWIPGQMLMLERNPLYFGKPANLDRIILKITPEETVRLLQLENGEVDMVESIPTKDIARLRNNPNLKLYPLQGRLLGYLQYNLRKPALADPRVRHAISLAIDRNAMVDGLMYGFAQPAGSVLAPVLAWAHDATLAPDPHDADRARALLAEAGWTDQDGDGVVEKDGQPLVVEIKTRTGDPVREDGVIILQENLSRVGIRATPRLLELATVLDQLKVGEFDIYYGQFRSRLSPDITSLFGSEQTHERGGSNYGGYSNAQVDALLRQAVNELDQGVARPLWHQVQRMIAEDQPWTMLYYRDQVVGINKRFRDCSPHVLSAYYGIERWWEAAPAAAADAR